MNLSDDVKDLLDDSGMPWELKGGGSHYKIYIGPRLVAIWPRGKGRSKSIYSRSHKNIVAQIRRAIREAAP